MATKMKIHPVSSLIPAMTDLEYYDLKADIQARGLQSPILLSKDGRIVDGRHRYKACSELKIEPTYVRSKFEDDATLARDVVSLNLRRRHLSESQQVLVCSRLTHLFEKDAKLRAEEGRKAGTEAQKQKRNPKSAKKGSSENLRSSLSSNPRKAAADAANLVGVNPRMVEHGKRVLQHGVPELIEAVERNEIPVTAASALTKHPTKTQKAAVYMIRKKKAKNVRDAVRKLSFAEKIAQIKATPPPQGIVDVLVVDPPWHFNKTREDDSTQRGRTPYPTMTEDQIKEVKLPIGENAVVWCWVTNAHLLSGEALRILSAWGLEARGLLTWAKTKMGTGDWLRGQTEHCILATKGKPVLDKPCPSTLLAAPVGQHSEKPDLFYAMVEKYCPGVKGELFSRKAREGWNQHGVELGSIPATPTPAKVPDPTKGAFVEAPAPGAMPAISIPPAPAGSLPPIVPQQ